MEVIDTITIGIFSLVIFITGISFSRSGGNVHSFFSAGGAVPWWMSGLSLYMSFFSVGTFVVWGSIAYSHGLVAVTIQSTMAIAGIVVGYYIAPRWNKTKVLTAAQFIEERLGSSIQKYYSYLFLLISLFTTGAFLYPVAKIVEVSTGFPLVVSIITIGVLVTIYTATGGLWAVLVTDVLQFVVLSAAVIIVVPLAFDVVDGFSGFLEKAPEGFFQLHNEEYTWLFMIAFGIYNMIYIGGNWAYVQRFTSVKSPGEARKVGFMFALLYIVSPLIWMLPPMIYRVLNGNLKGLADEGAYLLMSKEVLPVGLLGLVLGGMIFATASSINSTLNIAAGVFTNDLYKGIKKHPSDRHLMRVARIATMIFGGLTILVALVVPLLGGIVEVVLSVAAITGSALFLPPIWALFSKHQRGVVVFCVSLGSILINVLFKFLDQAILGFNLSRTSEMALGVLCPVLLLTIAEIWLRKRGEDKNHQRLLQLIKERDKNLESVEGTIGANSRGMRIIGVGVLVVGILMLTLGIMNIYSGYITLVVSLGVIGLGLYPILKK